VIKLFLFILYSFALMNCSLNENSKIWSQKNSISKKDKNLQIILDEKKETTKELNSKFKLNLSKIKFNNDIFNNYNNFGTQGYSGKFEKIGIYKFSKFDEVTELNFKPLFLEKSLIFFDKKGSIIKYDLDGKILWKKNYYNKFEKKSNPRLSFSKKENNLIVTDTLSKFYSINLNTGDLIWLKRNDYPFNSEIKVSKDKFFVIDLKNILRCFYIKDGSECWNLKTENSLTISNSKNSLILDNKQVIFNNSVGDITAVDTLTGSIIWQLPTQSSEIINETYSFKNSQLVSDGNDIFFSNSKNEFFSINKKNGSINWMNKVRSNLTPILLDDLIFTVSNEGYFYVINKNRGNVIRINDVYKDYKLKKRKYIKPTGFSVSQNELYLSNNNGKLKVIELISGNVIKNIKISRDTISKPTIYKNNLFVIKNGAIIQYE
tara:strand:- start:511 stop:1809 length:1299 start_codon:yes stop_codon:yes gene_type:complete